MAWIESHQQLGPHPKTARLARALSVSVPAAIGHLHLFWWWAMDYAPSGDITGFDPEEIAVAVMWPGEGEQFLTAMDKCRWTDLSPDGRRTIHDWQEYGGKLHAKREADKLRVRNWRATQAGTDVTRNEPVTYAQDGVTYNVDHTTQHNTTEQKITQQNGRVILTAEEAEPFDRTFEEEEAFLVARQAGYEADEIRNAINSIRRNGTQVKKLKSYLLTVLKSNRDTVIKNAAPVIDEFKGTRIPD